MFLMAEQLELFGNEEKKEESEEGGKGKIEIIPLAIYGILGAIIGGIVGVLLKQNFLYVIVGFLIGVIIGLILYGLSFLKPEQRKIVYAVLALVFIIGVGYFFITSLWSYFNLQTFIPNFSAGIKGLSSWWSCLRGSPECPAYAGWETNQTIKVPDFQLDLSYENAYIKNNSIDMSVKIDLINKKLDNLTMYPYCELKERTGTRVKRELLTLYSLEKYSRNNRFVFPKSEKKLSTGFKCKGRTNFQKESVMVGFNVPYLTSLSWTIYVNNQNLPSEETKIEKEKMPFDITVDLISDMPLGDGEYTFFLKLKKNPSYDFNLRKINFIKIEPTTPDTSISCEDFGNTIELSEESLKDFWNENKKEYLFECQLFIDNAPNDVVEARIININADYIVYKEFEKTVREV